MARPLKFRSGKIEVDIDKNLAEGFENIVNNLLPKTRAAIDRELDKIESEARSKWLVREVDSQNSRDKIYTEVFVSPTMELTATVGNTAPYAWAIRVGVDPKKTRLQMDRRLADGLLYSPMKRASNRIVKIFADEFARQMK